MKSTTVHRPHGIYFTSLSTNTSCLVYGILHLTTTGWQFCILWPSYTAHSQWHNQYITIQWSWPPQNMTLENVCHLGDSPMVCSLITTDTVLNSLSHVYSDYHWTMQLVIIAKDLFKLFDMTSWTLLWYITFFDMTKFLIVCFSLSALTNIHLSQNGHILLSNPVIPSPSLIGTPSLAPVPSPNNVMADTWQYWVVCHARWAVFDLSGHVYNNVQVSPVSCHVSSMTACFLHQVVCVPRTSVPLSTLSMYGRHYCHQAIN